MTEIGPRRMLRERFGSGWRGLTPSERDALHADFEAVLANPVEYGYDPGLQARGLLEAYRQTIVVTPGALHAYVAVLIARNPTAWAVYYMNRQILSDAETERAAREFAEGALRAQNPDATGHLSWSKSALLYERMGSQVPSGWHVKTETICRQPHTYGVYFMNDDICPADVLDMPLAWYADITSAYGEYTTRPGAKPVIIARHTGYAPDGDAPGVIHTQCEDETARQNRLMLATPLGMAACLEVGDRFDTNDQLGFVVMKVVNSVGDIGARIGDQHYLIAARSVVNVMRVADMHGQGETPQEAAGRRHLMAQAQMLVRRNRKGDDYLPAPYLHCAEILADGILPECGHAVSNAARVLELIPDGTQSYVWVCAHLDHGRPDAAVELSVTMDLALFEA